MIDSIKNGSAEIISIGDELLIGQVINSNASWLGEQLYLNGISLHKITTIGDNAAQLHSALSNALNSAQFVFITGGLGPTSDDITKPSLSQYFGVELQFNEEAFKQVEALFAKRGMKVTERNRAQAMLPANCIPIKNDNGTAPGMWFNHRHSIIVSMPGVPFEMKAMFVEQVLPQLKLYLGDQIFMHKTVMTSGVGESVLADKIKNWEENLPFGFKLAYLPQPGIVRLRLSGQGVNIDSVRSTLDTLVTELSHLLNEFVYGFDEELLEETVGGLLKSHCKTVATAESCTGGYIAHLLTSIAGSSAYFKGSVVAYANELKTALLDVHPQLIETFGAVSREVAEAMAKGLLVRLETDYAIATTGIAGPDGGTAEKPVGTVWIAIADKNKIVSSVYYLGDHRGRNIRRSALTALNMLRKELMELKAQPAQGKL